MRSPSINTVTSRGGAAGSAGTHFAPVMAMISARSRVHMPAGSHGRPRGANARRARAAGAPSRILFAPMNPGRDDERGRGRGRGNAGGPPRGPGRQDRGGYGERRGEGNRGRAPFDRERFDSPRDWPAPFDPTREGSARPTREGPARPSREGGPTREGSDLDVGPDIDEGDDSGDPSETGAV